MKRLSIAVEAIELPGLLVLDEPTSGACVRTAVRKSTACFFTCMAFRAVVMHRRIRRSTPLGPSEAAC